MPVADENNQPPLDESYNTLINFGIVGQEKKIYSILYIDNEEYQS